MQHYGNLFLRVGDVCKGRYINFIKLLITENRTLTLMPQHFAKL